MALAPFPITPQLTAIAIAYRNSRLIADEVLPRVPVSQQSFKYCKYALEDSFTLPNTLVGRSSKPNQVEFGFTEVDTSTRDYALDDPIPNADMMNAQGGYNPEARATEVISDLLALDREKRAADLVFAAASYATANKVQLVTNDQWNEYAQAASDPIADIVTGLDACVMRPNIMVLGYAVASTLRRHPAILKAYNGTTGDTGMVPLNFLRELFELEQVLVGQGWINTAKKGQTATMARVWGNHCALIYRDSLATASSGTTFGFTAQWGDRVAGSIDDPDIGMHGGKRVRVGESVKEVITASDLGYFIEDAI
jgi:hypothetical protein